MLSDGGAFEKYRPKDVSLRSLKKSCNCVCNVVILNTISEGGYMNEDLI